MKDFRAETRVQRRVGTEDSVEKVALDVQKCIYSYVNDVFVVVMDAETLDEIEIPRVAVVGDVGDLELLNGEDGVCEREFNISAL